MTNEYEDQHVVVTGGAGRLGVAVVTSLLERNAWCHAPMQGDVDRSGLMKHPRLLLVPKVNLTDEAAVTSFYASLPPLWASIHLAGGYSSAPVTDTGLQDFQRLFSTNAITSFLCCREAVRSMRTKTPSSGRIVNVAARPALTPTGGMIAYSVSKSAVAALTQSLAEEVKRDGIWVNAVAPSLIDTPENRKAMPDADFSAWPSPAEIAETILFLASPSNHLTSGAVIPVYGRA